MNIIQAFDLIVAETEVMMQNRYAKRGYIGDEDMNEKQTNDVIAMVLRAFNEAVYKVAPEADDAYISHKRLQIAAEIRKGMKK